MDIKHNSKTKYFKSGVVEREIIIHCHLKGANIPDHCVADMDFEAGDVYRLEYNGISNEVTSTEKDGAIHITDGTVDVYTKDTQLYVMSADEGKLPHEVKLVAEEKFNEGGVEWEDIENPPFGVKTEMVEIVPEQSVSNETNNTVMCNGDMGDGEIYTVIYDGTAYSCKAYFLNGAVVIGNATLLGMAGGNNEPFFAVCIDGTLMFPANTGTHDVSVTGPRVTITKIDEIFMPDGFPKVSINITEILPETTFTKQGENDDGEKYATFEFPFPMEYGNLSEVEYRVKINGETPPDGGLFHSMHKPTGNTGYGVYYSDELEVSIELNHDEQYARILWRGETDKVTVAIEKRNNIVVSGIRPPVIPFTVFSVDYMVRTDNVQSPQMSYNQLVQAYNNNSYVVAVVRIRNTTQPYTMLVCTKVEYHRDENWLKFYLPDNTFGQYIRYDEYGLSMVK